MLCTSPEHYFIFSLSATHCHKTSNLCGVEEGLWRISGNEKNTIKIKIKQKKNVQILANKCREVVWQFLGCFLKGKVHPLFPPFLLFAMPT